MQETANNSNVHRQLSVLQTKMRINLIVKVMSLKNRELQKKRMKRIRIYYFLIKGGGEAPERIQVNVVYLHILYIVCIKY